MKEEKGKNVAIIAIQLGSIDVAFLVDTAKLDVVETFAQFIVKRSATRDLFQVNLKTKPAGRDLIVVGNHWPSRSGGQYESAPYRMLAGETLAFWHQRMKEEKGKNVAIIAMGDFNDEPFDRSLTNYSRSFRSKAKVSPASGGQYESAPYRMLAGETLAFWHQRMKEEKGKNVAIIAMGDFNDEPFDRSLTNYSRSFRSKAKVRNARTPTFYNLMWPPIGERTGSHYFNNRPNMLDQFMVSRGMILNNAPLKVVDGSVKIEAFPEMVNPGQYPRPVRFGRPFKAGKQDPSFTGTGYSDHFPIHGRLLYEPGKRGTGN